MKLHKKFWVSLLAVAVVLLCVFALPEKAQAASESDLDFTLNSTGDGYIVSGCNTSASGVIVIPETYNDRPVVAIGEWAFGECKSLTSVKIPDGVTSIGASAFFNCPSLTSITIPDSVTYIGTRAFQFCSGLANLQVEAGNSVYHSAGDCIIETASKTLIVGCKSSRIPTDGSVTVIDDAAFYGCTGLTSITIPASVTRIGEYAFYGCSGLTKVIIQGGVTRLDNYAFCSCTELFSIAIPATTTSIGNWAFYQCSKLSYVTYCGTAEQWNAISVGNGNTYLTRVTRQYHKYENSVCTICQKCDPGILTFELNGTSDGYIVSACPQTAGGNLTIPATYNGLPVVGIGVKAFENCENLTSVRVPDSVTVIDWDSFYGCTALTSINIPDGITLIGSGAFYGCGNLTYNTYDNGKYLGSDTNPYLALITSRSSTVTSYEIHPDTRILAEYAVSSNNKLESITIPDSVKFIGMGAFNNDSGLTSVTFGNGGISIGEIAFYGCTKLTSVHISSGVVSIGEGAFQYCTALTSVSIADSVTSIGKNAFEYCRNLTKVIYCGTQEQWTAVQKGYPNTVLYGETLQLHNYENGTCTICQRYNGPLTFTLNNSGDGYIVSNCDTSASGELVIPATYNGLPIIGIGANAFNYCNGLNGITIPDSVTSIGAGAFAYCTSLTDITIPNGITSIESYTFFGCENLISVTLPDSVTGIGDYAFSYCRSLTSLTIPDNVTGIGQWAFGYCTNLTGITIPDSVTRIDRCVFGYCSSLSSLQVADANPVYHSDGNCIIETDSKQLIAGCKTSQIPADGSVAGIAMGAFFGCDSLTAIVIPNSVTAIMDYAFDSCTALAKVIYCGTQEQWDAISVGESNLPLASAALQLHDYENGICTICQHCNYIAGDINGDNVVDQKDAIYLLLYSWYGEEFYPMEYAPGDVNSDGAVEQKDAIYLLLHSWYGEEFYPLYPAPVPAPNPGEEEKPKPDNTGTPIT